MLVPLSELSADGLQPMPELIPAGNPAMNGGSSFFFVFIHLFIYCIHVLHIVSGTPRAWSNGDY